MIAKDYPYHLPEPYAMIEYVVGLIGTACLAVFGWAFTLHARVAVLEKGEGDLKELIESKFDDMGNRLARIESAMNGAFSKH